MKFDEFQLKEYEKIVNAHFETVKQVSDFFRYYLIILSVPAFLSFLFNKSYSLEYLYVDVNKLKYNFYSLLIGCIFFIISITGYLLCCYIINLRQDAVLYARTANGIRKYFYETINLLPIIEKGIRTLPIQNERPRYFEKHIFLPVITTFGLINSCYFLVALWLLIPFNSLTIIYSASFFILHFISYLGLAYYKENYYLRSHKIGIDIDGVLNDHKMKFCEILLSTRNKTLIPDEITEIPVHKIPGTQITKEDECYVFNTKDYWVSMPPIQNNFVEIKEIKKTLGYKIIIFSRRPWPDFTHIAEKDREKYKNDWIKWRVWVFKKSINIRKTTREWLKNHDIVYNKLVIERGNLDVSDTSFWLFRRNLLLTRNRYQYSHKHNLRYFVEDDYNNAMKLANICDYVFLIKQPYNQKKRISSKYNSGTILGRYFRFY